MMKVGACALVQEIAMGIFAPALMMAIGTRVCLEAVFPVQMAILEALYLPPRR
jgi:hypothetical protein